MVAADVACWIVRFVKHTACAATVLVLPMERGKAWLVLLPNRCPENVQCFAWLVRSPSPTASGLMVCLANAGRSGRVTSEGVRILTLIRDARGVSSKSNRTLWLMRCAHHGTTVMTGLLPCYVTPSW